MQVDRITEYGAPKRRILVIAEITARDSEDGDNYYSDDELPGVVENWIDSALNDRDDGPMIRFHKVPEILVDDVRHIADTARAEREG